MKTTLLTKYDQACPMNYPGFVFRELLKSGYSAKALLNGTGLTEERFNDPNSRVEFFTLRLFILNAIKETGDLHLGSRLALRFEPNYIGPPAYAAMNAETLIDGLETLGRFLHLTFPAFDFMFNSWSDSPEGRDAEICLSPKLPLEDVAYFVTSSALIVINNLLKDMVRLPVVVTHCEAAIAEPPGWADIATEVSRIPVRFGASVNRIKFPSPLLYHQLPGADPINHQRLVALCERFSADAGYVTSPISQIFSFLENERNLGLPLSDAATALGYSERGLRRQLERYGTTYRQLIEQRLEGRARDRLANSTMPINAIAYDLGFDTPSNFARSFKRWTGESPKSFRDRMARAAQHGHE
ncbi:AraC family transcriptional regulator [Asticcacaulis sp. AC402]|uniref:AraC family transcriptional regulator n=1 Tax=Asticcacaulis sp. AC402 TaxID=1282361 RepID=UPI0003C3E69A|nr:AraC family transcriptional regulator [Asticcacaulis sp. AC402]ESQ75140.1 hypothetical protein ABAC402_10755 [Asticcacaulis sp. AC402]